MQSLTKRRLAPDELGEMLNATMGIGCRVESELSDGWFNTAYRVRLSDGRTAIVKLAPPREVPVLRYERGIIATEALVYRLASTIPGVPLPELLYADDEFLVLSALDGTPWDKARELLPADAQPLLLRELGQITARFHTLVSPSGLFGYPAAESGLTAGTWREAFTGMVTAILADAQHWQVPLGMASNEVLALVDAHADVLDDVRVPTLVHFDLWPGNIFVTADGEKPRVTGLIDHERAFWGDPAAELVSLEFCGPIDADSELVAGYRDAGGQLDFDESLTRRLALYRLYLGLILVTECGPRGYGPEHVSFCHNLVAPWVTALRNL
ncbi:phosphotransferase family protein [Allorhizocola rhizosphaerae]|uniref:phosphotransferase family protein n=1 Tax=Allorhizocola rhizosphaerae TaxID=1872709 RepID=UPI001FE92BEF|nr:aminoglycoside phosphotransferase family protein [Allorhizocola rhizosphaerae]